MNFFTRIINGTTFRPNSVGTYEILSYSLIFRNDPMSSKMHVVAAADS